jgi:hypothetical protein
VRRREPRPGEVVRVGDREAIFLYRTREAAIVRFRGKKGSCVVPLSKLRCGA